MFEWVNKFIKKKKSMSPEQIAEIKEGLTRYKEFQWVKGENIGSVTYLKDVIEEDGIVFVTFTDNNRCNISLLDQYILKLGSGDAALDIFENKSVKAAVEQSGAAIVGQSRLNVPAQKLSPIQELLRKRKPNTVNISIELTLNVPPTELLEVLRDSFDNAEEEVVEFVLNSISQEDIKTSVRKALAEFYQLETSGK